jgi:uncharacterized phage protein (TIGR02218 family)
MTSTSYYVLCWKLTRIDGVIVGFTAHDKTLHLDDGSYVPLPGLESSSLSASASLEIDNLDFSAALNHAVISRRDVEAGRYDGARVEIFLIDWQTPISARIHLARLTIGDVDFSGVVLKAEAHGETETLEKSLIETLSPECRASLGDARCKVALRKFTRVGKILVGGAALNFDVSNLESETNYYAYGTARILSGDNTGFESRIVSSTGAMITLEDRPPFAVVAGTLIQVVAGCDKRFSSCATKFDNKYNFRGEPFVPGVDALLRYPGL